MLDIKVDCVADNNNEKWNQTVFGDGGCRAPEFLRGKSEYITYICISSKYNGEILLQSKTLGIAHIGDVNDILQDIICNYTDVYLKLLLELPYGKGSEFFIHR